MTLQVKALNYSFEHSQVLKDLHLVIKEGQINAVLGANGSGKSTLLKLIAGHLSPDSGDIYFGSEKVMGPDFKLIPGHPQISLVKQDSSLFPLHTVKENLEYILQSLPEFDKIHKIKELAKLLVLDKLLERKLKYLSGGEQQRVAIAAALASNPKLLLMDEPFSQTDMYLKNGLKKHLQNIVEVLDISILYVTHDPQDVLGFADEIMILENGKIVERGNSSEIYYRPKLKSTATLTGYCNWIPVENWNPSIKLQIVEGHYFLRPEQINIYPYLKENLMNTMEGTIDEIEFHGIYQLFFLSTHLGFGLIASLISFQHNYKAGEKVFIDFGGFDH